MENMLEGEQEKITRKCIDMALAGDPTALKIVWDRLCPVRRGRPLQGLARQKGEGTIEMILREVLEGNVTPEEGHSVLQMIEGAARVAVAQEMAKVRKKQVEAMETVGNSNAVMIVPLPQSLESWEGLARDTQKQLKAKVKE